MKRIELTRVEQDGRLALPPVSLPEAARQNCEATAVYYRSSGFVPPWVGYVSVAQGKVVGGGAFKGPPRNGKAEIAYYTLSGLEGQGFATATAQALIALAKDTDPSVLITAQTLPVPNASNALLKKLGFSYAGIASDPEAGEVWEWHLKLAT